jgi:hypothetical protein
MIEPKRTFVLPFGYAVTFCTPSRGGGIFDAEWDPRVPVIRKARQRRKFTEAYKAARREFLQELASTLGAAVLVIDADKKLEKAENYEVVPPPPLH